jgi:hypothetical protein
MTSAATILADIRRIAELLAEPAATRVATALDDAAAMRIATALSRFIRSENFDQALGLTTDWRMRQRFAAREAALRALIDAHPQLDSEPLARQIIAGVDRALRVDGTRPDGIDGYHHDLARLDLPGERQLRRIIADIRGHQDTCNGHASSAGCPRKRRPTLGPKKSLRR